MFRHPTLAQLQAGYLLQVDGGTGFDTPEHHLDASNPQTQFTGWGVINGHLTPAGMVANLGGVLNGTLIPV